MMRKLELVALSFLMLLAACSTDSDDSDDDNFDASVVCPAEGTNAYGMPNRGTFIDERDGQEYKYTTIGDQVWMAENLNYDAERSIVYDCNDSSCLGFGRYYYVGKDSSVNYMPYVEINKDLMDTLCPQGWHIPSKKEWEKLFDIMGGDGYKAATRLRSSEKIFYPDGGDPPGSDDCHFHTIPSGYTKKDVAHAAGYYLCSTQAYVGGLDIAIVYVSVGFTIQPFDSYAKRYEYPVRCIKD